MKNARSTGMRSIAIFSGAVIFTILVALIAALELAVAVQFQFRDQVPYFGLPWPGSELPKAAVFSATLLGPALWLAVALVGWTATYEKEDRSPSEYHQSVITAITITCLAVFPTMGVVIDLSAVPVILSIALWLNVAMWCLAAAISIIGTISNLEGLKIRYAKT